MNKEVALPEDKRIMVEAIKNAKDSASTRNIASSLKDFLKDPEVKENIIPELLNDSDAYRRALLLMAYNLHDMPQEYIDKYSIRLYPDIAAEPRAAHPAWFLCVLSEERMKQSLSEYSTIAVAGLMVKFVGRITGYCFESFSTNAGTFIAGNFYSPDIETQHQLKQFFVQGVNRPALAGGEWYLMRGARAEIKDLYMPPEIPQRPGDLERAEYLQREERYPE
jgi:hypothetical protein